MMLSEKFLLSESTRISRMRMRFHTSQETVCGFLESHLQKRWKKQKKHSFHNKHNYVTVEPVLKTTSIKRPPLHNDHSQVRPSNIW